MRSASRTKRPYSKRSRRWKKPRRYDTGSNGGKITQPTFTAPAATYDTRTMTLFDDDTASLSTAKGRVRRDLALPEDDAGYQRQYPDSDEWSVMESTLTARDSNSVLTSASETQDRDRTDHRRDGTVLGIENLAVTGTAFFVSGRELPEALTHRRCCTPDRRTYRSVRRPLR